MSSLYSFYKNTPGLQVKRDMDFSNVTIQCDPRLVVPDSTSNQTSGIFKKDTAGKIAVEHEICDLDVSNLTVSGQTTLTNATAANLTVSGNLIANGISEICDIVCPDNFSATAAVNVNLDATAGNITGKAGSTIQLKSEDTFSATAPNAVTITATATGNNPIGNATLSAQGKLTLGQNDSIRETDILAGTAVSMEGTSEGVRMRFASGTAASSLAMTHGTGPLSEAQADGVNGVCGKIIVDSSILVQAANIDSFGVINNKVKSTSVILVSLDQTGLGIGEIMVVSTSAIVDGKYTIVVTNLSAIDVDIEGLVFHYLVINPT